MGKQPGSIWMVIDTRKKARQNPWELFEATKTENILIASDTREHAEEWMKNHYPDCVFHDEKHKLFNCNGEPYTTRKTWWEPKDYETYDENGNKRFHLFKLVGQQFYTG